MREQQKGQRGKVLWCTGISSPYEEPTRLDVHIYTDELSIEQAADKIIAGLGVENR